MVASGRSFLAVTQLEMLLVIRVSLPLVHRSTKKSLPAEIDCRTLLVISSPQRHETTPVHSGLRRWWAPPCYALAASQRSVLLWCRQPNTVCALFPDHNRLQLVAQDWELFLKPPPEQAGCSGVVLAVKVLLGG